VTCIEKTKIKKKRPGKAHLKKRKFPISAEMQAYVGFSSVLPLVWMSL